MGYIILLILLHLRIYFFYVLWLLFFKFSLLNFSFQFSLLRSKSLNNYLIFNSSLSWGADYTRAQANGEGKGRDGKVRLGLEREPWTFWCGAVGAISVEEQILIN